MTEIIFYEDIFKIYELPTSFFELEKLIGNVIGIQTPELMIYEYQFDKTNQYFPLTEESYNLMLTKNKLNKILTIYVRSSPEEALSLYQNCRIENKIKIESSSIKEEKEGEIEGSINQIKKQEFGKTKNKNEPENKEEIKKEEVKEEKIKNHKIEEKDGKKDKGSNEQIEILKKEDKMEILLQSNSEQKINNFQNRNRITSIQNESETIINNIFLPEIPKERVIASIVKQVKENMNKSRILKMEQEKKLKELKEKEEKQRKEKEKEQQKRSEESKENKNCNDFNSMLSSTIAEKFDNIKKELINESQIKITQIISESKLENNINKNSIEIETNLIKEEVFSTECHPGISCNGCGINPIIGVRFYCVNCENFNYCQKCEEEKGLFHSHPMYKLKFRLK